MGDFSVWNALFSAVFSAVIVGGVLWYKLTELRGQIHAALKELSETLPVGPTTDFLMPKIDELESMVTQILVRLERCESLLGDLRPPRARGGSE